VARAVGGIRQGGGWLRRPPGRPPGSRRVVCFPHVGGGASFFRSWHDGLPPGVELLAVQYPGREDRTREPFIDDMDRMADAVTDALAGCLGEPLVLFGHSMGAAIAYEVALRIGARSGHRLRGVVLSAQPSPRHFVPASLHLLSDDELWTDTMRFNGIAGGTERGSQTLRRLLMPVLRNDYRLIETYRPRLGATVDCPVVACLGDADPAVTLESVQGWHEITRHGFDLRVFPGGDHFYLKAHREELVAIALRALGDPG
jgi:pyochelin biosynthesis protein PchC